MSQQPVSASCLFDYCNWQRIPARHAAAAASTAASVAAQLMRSRTAQLLPEHVAVRYADVSARTLRVRTSYRRHGGAPTGRTTSWVGSQAVCFWALLDRCALLCVPRSHRSSADTMETDVQCWEVYTGDAVALHSCTLQRVCGRLEAEWLLVFSLRFVGDDARYVERLGPTSPLFTGHEVRPGDRLREDWYPVLHWGAERTELGNWFLFALLPHFQSPVFTARDALEEIPPPGIWRFGPFSKKHGSACHRPVCASDLRSYRTRRASGPANNARFCPQARSQFALSARPTSSVRIRQLGRCGEPGGGGVRFPGETDALCDSNHELFDPAAYCIVFCVSRT